MTGIHQPSTERIEELASTFTVDLGASDLEYVERFISDFSSSFERLDELGEPSTPSSYTNRETGYRPGPTEDEYNAFVTKCEVQGADCGSLSGYSVGLKDNIAVAAIEMTAGSKLLSGFTPSRDSTVTQRLLDAGSNIVGKTTMFPFAFFSDDIWRTNTGVARNPHDATRVASGSSGGSAAAVVNGDVDIAIGTDQGGSIRLPAAWCGCVGLKPTFGLVPYTGILSVAETLDHVGPITETVEDCARTLQVISGCDMEDPRQPSALEVPDFVSSFNDGVEDLTIGVITSAFEQAPDDRVANLVRTKVESLEDEGATVHDVAIPWAENGDVVFNAMMLEGIAEGFRTNGVDYTTKQVFDRFLVEEFGKARSAMADDLPLPMKATLILGSYLSEDYHGRYFAKALNLIDKLIDSYETPFESVDLLAMPTAGTTAIPFEEGTPVPIMADIEQRTNHVAHFNVTGHPAISVPCGMIDGLPVGAHIVGERFKDDVVLRGAQAIESAACFD